MTVTISSVSLGQRHLFEAEVRDAVMTLNAAGEKSVDKFCEKAWWVAQRFDWADASSVANALVDILGPGWGAIYLDWLWGREDDS